MTSQADQQRASQLVSRLAAEGPMRISRFMQIAACDPDFGYYSQPGRIGKSGDFITAPEISPLFGEMLAALLIHLWELSGKPADALVFEAGPGSGQLMADMRRVFDRLAPPLHTAPLWMLEASPALRDQQASHLNGADLHYTDQIEALPGRPLFGAANEFFDALGVDQAIFQAGDWHHRLIGLADGQFAFLPGAALSAAEKQAFDCARHRNAKEGMIAEYSPAGAHFITRLARHIAHYGGAFLIIDYGGSELTGSSLQAVQAHEKVDFLSHAGTADLTFLVDFARLGKVARAEGARLVGPVEQGAFLTQLGITRRAEQLASTADAKTRHSLRAAIDRLTSPAWMGSLFKVALLIPPGEGLPPGFADTATQTGTGPEK